MTRGARRLRRLQVVLAVLAVPASAAATPLFTGLGIPPSPYLASGAYGVSSDGSIVVGAAGSSNGDDPGAVVWKGGGPILLDSPSPGGQSEAFAVSDDGQIIVGAVNEDIPDCCQRPARWIGGAFEYLEHDPNQSGRALAVSADGTVIVGESASNAVRWDNGAATVLAPGHAYGVSADGTVIVGQSNGMAFRWEGGILTTLGDLPGGSPNSNALNVSGDGSTVLGIAGSGFGTEAFRWTAAEGMVGLGDLAGGDFFSFATGASIDGSAVVGLGTIDPGPVGRPRGAAFYWTAALGMTNLQDLLESYGLDLSGWHLAVATAVSADGHTIVGSGTNPEGEQEAWLAQIPEPASALLLAFGLCAIALMRHR